jgi:hypothetical protein
LLAQQDLNPVTGRGDSPRRPAAANKHGGPQK